MADLNPTVRGLTLVLATSQTRLDRSLRQAREVTGRHCDPTEPDHAVALRAWLNAWACRIGVPPTGATDPFLDELSAWWHSVRQLLPPVDLGLGALTDADISQITAAYRDLVRRPAAVNRAGRVRTFGPTATAKLLYYMRPMAITAWDRAISAHVGGNRPENFEVHLRNCRAWAQDLIEEAALIGVDEHDIGALVGRPESTVAKLIDEWLYQTMTRGQSAKEMPPHISTSPATPPQDAQL